MIKAKQIITLLLSIAVLSSSFSVPVQAEEADNNTPILDEAEIIINNSVDENVPMTESDETVTSSTEIIESSADDMSSDDTEEFSAAEDELIIDETESTELIETIEPEDVQLLDNSLSSSPAPYQNENGETIISVTTRSGKTYNGDANARLADQINVTGAAHLTPPELKRIRTNAKQIVNELITDNMSDLEKYWTLYYKGPYSYCALHGLNGPDELPAPYNSSHYWHTAIGPLGFNKSSELVCQGNVALFIELCYAAGLPCYGIYSENHVSCYIPNINGKDYYGPLPGSNYGIISTTYPYQLDIVDLTATDLSYATQPDEYGRSTSLLPKNPEEYAEGTFDEWYADVLAANPNFVDYGSATRGVHYAKIPDNARAIMENLYAPEAKNPTDIILNVNSSYTNSNLSETNAPGYVHGAKLPIYKDWNVYDDHYAAKCTYDDRAYRIVMKGVPDDTFTYNRIEHDCLTEGCISFDQSTGEIKVLKELDPKRHVMADPNTNYYVGDDYDASKEYYVAHLFIETGKCDDKIAGYIEQDIYVPYTPSVTPTPTPTPTPGPDDPDNPDPIDPDAPKFKTNSFDFYFDETKGASDVITGTVSDDYELLSANPAIVTIDDAGNLTGHSGGTTRINIYKGDTVIDTATVTIRKPTLTGPDELTVGGANGKYVLSFEKSGYRTKWKSSDSSVLEITSSENYAMTMYFKPKSAGTATVSCVDRRGDTHSIEVTVRNKPMFTAASKTLNVDQKFLINDDLFDTYYCDSVTFASSNTGVATVSGRTVTPVASGKAVITATAVTTSGDTVTSSLNITVYNPVLSGPSDLYLDNKTATFKVTGRNGATIWSSSNPDVLSVSNKGVAKGVAGGTADVIAVNNGKTMKITVNVHRIPRLIVSNYKVNLGNTVTIDDTIFDAVDIDSDKISYTLAKTKIATITGNTVTPTKTGSCSVTIKAGTKSFTLKITVYNPTLTAPDIMYLNNSTSTLKITSGDSVTTWSVDKPEILSITNKGVIKGISQGHATVTAVNNGKTMTKDIYVCPVPKFTVKSITINNGDTLDLDNIYFDDSGIGNTVYTVANKKVLAIDENNIVTGLNRGSSNITAKVDGKTYTMSVNVYAPALTGPNTLLLDGKTANLKVTNGVNTTTWSSSDPNTVSITNKGVIKGLKKGSATITAVNNGRTMTQTINVYNVPYYQKAYTTNLDIPADMKLNKDDDMPNPVYTVNNAKIASINAAGVLTPIKTGTVTVYATVGGKKYQTKVVIYDPTLVAPNIIYLNNKTVKLSIKNGNKTTEWYNNNPEILSLTANGIAKGKANGWAKITAKNNGRTIEKNIYVCNVPKWNYKSVTINDGDTLDLDNIYFDDSDIGNTVFTSSKPAVLSIDENNIAKGLSRGSSTITALCGNAKYTFNVNVYTPVISGPETLLLNNKTGSLTIKNGLGATTWSSSDDTIVSITKNGVIKGLKKGSAEITAVNNGRTIKRTIYVYNVPHFEKQYVTNLDMPINVTLDKDADMPNPVYSVSNVKIAKIDQNGVVTPIKTGSVTVYATVCGVKYQTTVKIFNPAIKGANSVKIGKTSNFSITNGYGATAWSVDDSTIASITDKGVLKGLKTGTVVITAENNGRTMTKNVLITP